MTAASWCLSTSGCRTGTARSPWGWWPSTQLPPIPAAADIIQTSSSEAEQDRPPPRASPTACRHQAGPTTRETGMAEYLIKTVPKAPHRAASCIRSLPSSPRQSWVQAGSWAAWCAADPGPDSPGRQGCLRAMGEGREEVLAGTAAAASGGTAYTAEELRQKRSGGLDTHSTSLAFDQLHPQGRGSCHAPAYAPANAFTPPSAQGTSGRILAGRWGCDGQQGTPHGKGHHPLVHSSQATSSCASLPRALGAAVLEPRREGGHDEGGGG
ncbi:hypothetical protein HaLaN_17581, partial [Haematococcus lacustris]